MSKRKSSTRKKTSRHKRKSFQQKHAVRIIQAIYRLARSDNLLDTKAIDPSGDMLRSALRNRDTGLIFDWLAGGVLSLNGISDRVAIEYIRKNGSASWKTLSAELARKPTCPKLTSFWHYEGCGYSKTLRTCARPEHFQKCPVPTMRLRNGGLNIMSLSLLLWIRDVADGDLVRWLRTRIRAEKIRSRSIQEDRDRLVVPLIGIWGLSSKLISMAFSDLLLAAPPRWKTWHRIGGSLVVIDTLLHNNLVRSGVLARNNAGHNFGIACYQPRGCAEIIDRVSIQINAAPRAVSHAIWRYCAQDGLNICNGNQIDDRHSCKNTRCRLYGICDRRPLHVT